MSIFLTRYVPKAYGELPLAIFLMGHVGNRIVRAYSQVEARAISGGKAETYNARSGLEAFGKAGNKVTFYR